MKKCVVLVFVFCCGFGELKSQNDDYLGSLLNINMELYSGYSYSSAISNLNTDKITGREASLIGVTFNTYKYNSESFFDNLNFGFELNNLGYNFEQNIANESINNIYKLTYLSLPLTYRIETKGIIQNNMGLEYRSKKEIQYENNLLLIIIGTKLSYLFDVNLNNNKMKSLDISNEFNRYDLFINLGIGYFVYLEDFNLFIVPTYNISLLNHKKSGVLKSELFNNNFFLKVGVEFDIYNANSTYCDSGN